MSDHENICNINVELCEKEFDRIIWILKDYVARNNDYSEIRYVIGIINLLEMQHLDQIE